MQVRSSRQQLKIKERFAINAQGHMKEIVGKEHHPTLNVVSPDIS
jgi:hypothetical protein